MTQGKSIEHMNKGRCKKARKAKTPAEIYQWLESNPAPRQWKLILAASVPTPTVPGWWRWNKGDNDPNHSQANSRLVSEKENKAARMASQSPDLNPIENKN